LRRRLITGGGSIEYAQLVLALGARPRAVAIDGDAADSVLRVSARP
jgi:NADPH-dependent 2,4-dienoyl-CoA reductase/sulfur reductase-like enzyme